MAATRLQRTWLVLLVIVPLVLVTLAYAWLAVVHGTPWLWNVVVHEGGHYTLGQTVLFVRHHLREIPVDLVMALSLAWAVRLATTAPVPVSRRWSAVFAGLLVTTAFVTAAGQEGWWEALRDLLQFRTRDDDVSYGSHWRFHWLSTIWFCGAAPLLAGITAGLPGPPRSDARSRHLMFAAWGSVALLTIAFGVNADPFTSARYIGHQAREILTHGLITLPLVFALCVLAAGVVPAGTAHPASPAARAFSWLAVVCIPAFLIVAFGGGELEGTAQLESGLSGVVATHVFEHLLDYLLVAATCLALVGRERRSA